MDAIEGEVAERMSVQPLRHAALVHDLVYDRRPGVRRGLDAKIVSRHSETVLRDLADVVRKAVAEGGDPLPTAQTAVSSMIHRTHAAMASSGYLTTDADAGALAGGRMLFAAAMALPLASAALADPGLQTVSG